MQPMERSEIGTLQEIPILPANPSTGNRRRGHLKSRTVDTLLHILSICYADSSHITQNSGSVTKGDVTLTKIMPNDSVNQEETNADETRVILGTQEEGLCNTHVEHVEEDHNHNISEEKKDLSSTHLVTDKDVEEGEISGEFLNLIPEDDDVETVDKTGSEHEDVVSIESGFEKKSSVTPLSINTVDDVVISKTRRNLVDYSEIATKNQDFASTVKVNGTQNNKKRQRSCTLEKRTNKKARKSVDQSTCSKALTTIGENPKVSSQEIIGASVNKDADSEKNKRGGLTAEGKTKKKRKDRIKRAENNRKLGVKRLILKPVIKEKKITYCRHFINGRCHEGENCKFSHDMIPLTKSKPCCHFARNSCMKGDDCPYDHQLSKYPCNNYFTQGSCLRGSNCMFSHEAQTSEASLNNPNESTSVQKPPNPSSKMQIKEYGEITKMPPVIPKLPPPSVQPPKRDLVMMTTPKLTPQPPKGISFFSQGKLPIEPQLSPKVNSEVKESGEITKTPPRGINFLSFGKKHGVDGGFSFKIGKSPLSKPEEGIIVNMDDDGVKKGTISESPTTTDGQKTCFQKPMMPVLPFLSSTSQRTLQSTMAFAAKFDSGVKTSRSGI